MELDDTKIVENYLAFAKDKGVNDYASSPLTYFGQLIRSEPTNYIAWHYFHVLKYHQLAKNNPKRAALLYRLTLEAVETSDERCEHYTVLAYLSDEGSDDELLYLQLALVEAPEHVPLLIDIARKTPDKTDALVYLEEALLLDPDNDVAKQYYAYLQEQQLPTLAH